MEILFQLLFEVVGQLFGELLGETFQHSLGNRRPTQRWVAYWGCVIIGGLAGLAMSLVFPRPILSQRVTGLSLLVSPLITASMMYLLGVRFQQRAAKPGALTSFSGAWVLAMSFSAVRLWMVTRS